MITLAKRLNGISEYYFASKMQEIARLRKAGRDVLNLGVGSPDKAPAASVRATFTAAQEQAGAHGYQAYNGIPALRQAWADWYRRYFGVTLDADTEILPLMGSKEGIVHIAMTFLEPGDLALVPDPGYPSYRAASLLAGAEVQAYTLQASDHWLPRLDLLEQQDLSRVKIMWVNYPHMPTGAPASASAFQELIDFGKKHNILVVNDNPYSFILNDQYRSILAAEGALDVAIELNSLSKSHHMAGWRIGMIAGRAEYIKAILRFKSNMDSGQFLPIQQAAVTALQLSDRWYQELNSLYQTRREIALELLEALHCKVEPDQQGLFLWAQIPRKFSDGYAFSDHLLQQANLFLTPGGVFGDAGKKFVRLSLCSSVDLFEEAVRRVRQLSDPVVPKKSKKELCK